ncbi:hypothetical protein [Desulfosporosinus sp. I2]|uniref:hypothetical protein n=1 Tax=Desulfosporosinus sp. I2 TaxID=1617025 RepID=UPI0005F035AA|nr:hypothetical protein [Desulfosporosinus sp. I2]
MWNKSAKLLVVRVKVQSHRRFTFPVPIWVVNQFLEALTDLAWVGEMAIRKIPVPRDEKAGKHLRWVKTISPSGIIAATHNIIKDLSDFKGLDIVHVETEDVQVKVSIK